MLPDIDAMQEQLLDACQNSYKAGWEAAAKHFGNQQAVADLKTMEAQSGLYRLRLFKSLPKWR